MIVLTKFQPFSSAAVGELGETQKQETGNIGLLQEAYSKHAGRPNYRLTHVAFMDDSFHGSKLLQAHK
jgi:hypothetical protein